MGSRSRGLADPASQPPREELRRGDELLGWVEPTEEDDDWRLGRFIEGPAFIRYAALFERLWSISQQFAALEQRGGDADGEGGEGDSDEGYEDNENDERDNGLAYFALHDQWSEALERINALQLTLGGASIRDLRIELVEGMPVEYKLDAF